jgi:PAS domain S-box-containing protein
MRKPNRMAAVTTAQIVFVVALAISAHTIMTFIGYQQVTRFEAQSLAFTNAKLSSQTTLRRLSDAFGYGGYIHHFKNIVLRKDYQLISFLKNDARIIDESLEQLRMAFNNEGVNEAIAEVRATLNEYRSKEIYFVQDGSISSEKVDQLVKVDDTKALNALRVLRETIDNSLQNDTASLNNIVDETRHVFILWMLTSSFYLLLGYFVYLLVVKQRKDAIKFAALSEKLDTVLENTPSAIIISDDDGYITYSNVQANNLFKVHNDQIIGTKVEQWLPHRFRDGHTRKRTNFVANNGIRAMDQRQDLVALRGNGEEFPVKVDLKRIKNEHESIVIAILRDVTFDKKLQKKRVQQQRLEAVGRLTAGIVHDFNNMLAVIMGSVDVIESEQVEDSTKHIALNSIRNASDKAAQLTKKLLTFSREQELHSTQVNVPILLEELNVLLSGAVGEDIDITVSTQPYLWECYLDKVQLESAIMNLTVNAKHAMPQGGDIDISANNYQHSISASNGDLVDLEPGEYVVINVTDSGCGMSEEVLEHIFEPFFTAREGGTGLGLSMVFGFVKQSGGAIRVRSELNKGTTFMLYLPRHVEDVNEIKTLVAADVEASKLKGVRVLIVEDDPMVSAMVEKLLSMCGAVVLKASTQEEAINAALSLTLDAVVSDIVLKNGENGREVFEKLKSIQPNLKVLYSSGYFESDLKERKLIDEAQKVLKKPYNKNELYKSLIELLQ